MFGNIGPWELVLILLIALIVVGPGKLPDVAKSLGKGINEFKKATSGVRKEFEDAVKLDDTTKSKKPSQSDEEEPVEAVEETDSPEVVSEAAGAEGDTDTDGGQEKNAGDKPVN